MTRIIVIIIFLLLNACSEKEVDIGDGYWYIQLDGRNWAIAYQKNKMVVDPNVKKFQVVNNFILGERDNANIDERLSKMYGFFIYDKQTKILIEGLGKGGFESALRARGLPENPF